MTTGGTPPPLEHLVAVPTRRGDRAAPLPDLEGTDLAGAPTAVPLVGAARWTLLLFLSSRCDGCRSLWPAAASPADAGMESDEEAVVVTRDASAEDLGELRSLVATTGRATRVRLVMSSDVWRAYGVLGPPFFAVVDGEDGSVVTEGVGWSVEQVARDVRRARRTRR